MSVILGILFFAMIAGVGAAVVNHARRNPTYRPKPADPSASAASGGVVSRAVDRAWRAFADPPVKGEKREGWVDRPIYGLAEGVFRNLRDFFRRGRAADDADPEPEPATDEKKPTTADPKPEPEPVDTEPAVDEPATTESVDDETSRTTLNHPTTRRNR